MKRVVVTGHTVGIGAGIAEYFERQGYQVQGFSRSQGHDIRDPEVRDAIVEACKDADIFVNNAYFNHDDSQLILAQRVRELWYGQLDRLMIVSGTRFTEEHVEPTNPRWPYYEHKKRLDDYCVGRFKGPSILVLRMGFVETPRTAWVPEGRAKMSVDQVVSVLDWIMQNRTTVSITAIGFGPPVISAAQAHVQPGTPSEPELP